MKKKYSLVLIAFLCLTATGFGQGSESFTNLTAPGNSYDSGSYTGDNGLVWTYYGARLVNSTYNITGNSVGLEELVMEQDLFQRLQTQMELVI